MMFFGVLAIGIGGAIVARFEPDGMGRAMFVTAAATVLVGVIALILGKHEAEYSSVFEILGLTGMFATLFAGSAWLFHSAGAQQNRADSLPTLICGPPNRASVWAQPNASPSA
jgi:hypothetical protein